MPLPVLRTDHPGIAVGRPWSGSAHEPSEITPQKQDLVLRQNLNCEIVDIGQYQGCDLMHSTQL